MQTANIDVEVENIVGRFQSAGIAVDKNKVKESLNKLLGYRVPLNEAVRTVTTSLRKQYNLPFEGLSKGEAPLVPIASIKEDNKWVTIKGKVIRIWEPNSEAISQTGLIGDDSGIIKFTIFAKSQEALKVTLQEEKSYELHNVVSSMWQGQASVKINSNSRITLLQEDIKAERQKTTVAGMITAILQGSGLIKRCPECNRKLSKGSCSEHGKVEGVFDLRVKACLMDSVPSNPPKGHELIINADIVEKITGISLDKAREMATEALDTDAVLTPLTQKFLFGHFKVTGVQLPGNFLVEQMEPINGITADLAKEVKKLIAALTGGN